MKHLIGFALLSMTLVAALAVHAQDEAPYSEAQINKTECHAAEQHALDLPNIIRHDENELELKTMNLKLAEKTDAQGEKQKRQAQVDAAKAQLQKDLDEESSSVGTPASCRPQD